MSFDQSSPANSNYVLAALSAPDYEHVMTFLKPCLLHLGQTLYEKGEAADQVYFPKTGAISLVLSSNTGVDVEVGLIGREGSLGAPEVLGQHPMTTRAMVQIAGSGWKMSAQVLLDEFRQGGALQNTILRASYFQAQQTAQCVLCNRLHSVEKRLARWLLMCQDRTHLENLELTHEFIANMLGTRRVGVTLAMGVLREAGLIHYSRGQVTICDRAGLEKCACECYGIIQVGFEALRPPDQ